MPTGSSGKLGPPEAAPVPPPPVSPSAIFLFGLAPVLAVPDPAPAGLSELPEDEPLPLSEICGTV
jgi:hypothetical protein